MIAAPAATSRLEVLRKRAFGWADFHIVPVIFGGLAGHADGIGVGVDAPLAASGAAVGHVVDHRLCALATVADHAVHRCCGRSDPAARLAAGRENLARDRGL